jgi:hypothetical protein
VGEAAWRPCWQGGTRRPPTAGAAPLSPPPPRPRFDKRSESAAYAKRLKNEVKGLTKRLKNVSRGGGRGGRAIWEAAIWAIWAAALGAAPGAAPGAGGRGRGRARRGGAALLAGAGGRRARCGPRPGYCRQLGQQAPPGRHAADAAMWPGILGSSEGGGAALCSPRRPAPGTPC